MNLSEQQEALLLVTATAITAAAGLLGLLDLLVAGWLPKSLGFTVAALAALMVLICYALLRHHTQRDLLRVLLMVDLIILIARLPYLS